MAEIRVGVAGWVYAPWRGNFYPKALKQGLELGYASRRFNSLEINGTFYSLQSPSSFQSWYDATPPDFVFALKGGKYATHNLKLKEPRQALANYFASGLLCLQEKLGPILWQFPPNLHFNLDRCKEFFDLLPRDTLELAKLGKQHDAHVKKGVFLEPNAKRPLRQAVEIRHESYLTDQFIDLLRQHNIGLVIADADSKFPSTEDVTADFVYVRLHGERVGHESGYTLDEIQTWATKIETWHKGKEPADARRIGEKGPAAKNGRDVFVFFDNTEEKVLSPVNARQMVVELGLGLDQSEDQVLNELGIKPATGKKPLKKRRKPPEG